MSGYSKVLALRTPTRTTLFVVFFVCFASVGLAQTPEPQPLETLPFDQGFGQEVVVAREFPSPDVWLTLKDKRGRLDAAADRSISLPTAFTPEAGTLSYTNVLLLVNQVSYSETDTMQTSLTLVPPFDSTPLWVVLSHKMSVYESEVMEVSVQPFLSHHGEYFDQNLSDTGLGVGVMADFYLFDSLVLTAGVQGMATLWYNYQQENIEKCGARSEYPECVVWEDKSLTLPPGGHFLMVSAALTYFFTDRWTLRAELIGGGSAGTFLGTEWVNSDLSYAQRRERFEQGDWESGIPFKSDVTLGVALGYSNGGWSAILGFYAYSYEEQDSETATAHMTQTSIPTFSLAFAW